MMNDFPGKITTKTPVFRGYQAIALFRTRLLFFLSALWICWPSPAITQEQRKGKQSFSISRLNILKEKQFGASNLCHLFFQPGNRYGKVKCGPMAKLAIDTNTPLMFFNNSLGYGQSQPGTALSSCGPGTQFAKMLK